MSKVSAKQCDQTVQIVSICLTLFMPKKAIWEVLVFYFWPKLWNFLKVLR